jgi:hypothetical protein
LEAIRIERIGFSLDGGLTRNGGWPSLKQPTYSIDNYKVIPKLKASRVPETGEFCLFHLSVSFFASIPSRRLSAYFKFGGSKRGLLNRACRPQRIDWPFGDHMGSKTRNGLDNLDAQLQ